MDELKNISKDEMKKYLKKILELESEKYRLTEIKEQLDVLMLTEIRPVYDKNYEVYNTDSKEITRKKDYEMFNIQKEKEKNIDSELKKFTEPKKTELQEPEDFSGYFMIIMGVGSILALFSGLPSGNLGILMFIAVVGISFILIGRNIFRKNDDKRKRNKKIEEDYQNALIRYNEYILKYKNKLNEEYDELTKDRIKEIEDKYKKENEEILIIKKEKDEIVTNLIEKNDELINIIQKNLKLVNSKLEELYSTDIIFEKYRNLIAISMFYEYFVSSRVNELEGRDGAYNLFETEIRQNIVIVKLNDICEHLEDIKQNQYCMYKELENVNISLGVLKKYTSLIEKHLNHINNNVSDLKEIDQYILVCSNEINKNINKIKNITIADFLLK